MPRPRPVWRRLAALAGLLAAFAACTPETPTQLGSDLRRLPDRDSLQVETLDSALVDSVFHYPVTLGYSLIGQLGSQFPYTTHVLYDFKLKTRLIADTDTLKLDAATFLVRTDSLSSPPFEGVMRLGLRQVSPAARGWVVDSVRTGLPTLEPGDVAPDKLIDGKDLVDTDTGAGTFGKELAFTLDLPSLAGFDSLQALDDTLDVNLAIVFEGFDAGGPGFMEIFHRDKSGLEAGHINGSFVRASNGQVDSIQSIRPSRRMTRVEYDSTYSRGTKLVMSDGYPLRSFLKFAPLGSVLPDSAAVHLAELVLTQVESADGTSFGTSPTIGVVVPNDTLFTSLADNRRGIAFSAPLVALPGSTVTIPVTAYFFDIREGEINPTENKVRDYGMILRLSNEGTKARHFEFYGPGTPDQARRPRLRIVYSLPAAFEGEGHKPSGTASARGQAPRAGAERPMKGEGGDR